MKYELYNKEYWYLFYVIWKLVCKDIIRNAIQENITNIHTILINLKKINQRNNPLNEKRVDNQ